VCIDGETALMLHGEGIATEFQAIVESYVARRFGGRDPTEPVGQCGTDERRTVVTKAKEF